MIRAREPAPTAQPSVSRETPKRWTVDNTATLDAACTTGKLPDGRIATQVRLALYLGFSRQTIVARLAGRRLPMCNELMRAGGIKSARRRAHARAAAIKLSGPKVRTVRSEKEQIIGVASDFDDVYDDVNGTRKVDNR